MLMEVTDASIVAQALQKAIDNGYSLGEGEQDKLLDYAQFLIDEGVVMAILVQHKFAKALWGDRFINPVMRDDKGSEVIAMQQTAWRHHLRQMVTADNPIAYLAQNI